MTQIDPVPTTGELLRRTMRRWTTGVTIVTSRSGDYSHGMTVSSFTSISVDPPLVSLSMNHDARTGLLVLESGIFAVTILGETQQALAEIFAGWGKSDADRMESLDLFYLKTGAPLIQGGIGYLDCRVVYRYPMPTSTLFVGEVVAAKPGAEDLQPLVYYDRNFKHLAT